MSSNIVIDKVVKKYGDKTIIDGLSLNIKQGEFFTLLGPSGCGKTTLLRMIIGFNSIESGEIKINGQRINETPVNKRNMGMVFQNYAIFPHMSVKDNVAFGLKNRKIKEDELNKRVDEILETVKIANLKDRMPDQLSGGQQQRVALARAIVIHPDVLLMDEPLSNLDAKLRVEMRNAIKLIQQDIGITTVYVTHDQEEALAVSDRIAVMNNGIIQQVGSPVEIYERPKNVFVSTFIGTSNLLRAEVVIENAEKYIELEGKYREKIDTLKEDIPAGQVIVSIRPNEFIIDPEEGIQGKVINYMFLGINTHYFVELEDKSVVEVIQNSDGNKIIEPASLVKLKINAAKINVYDKDTEESLIRTGD